MHKNLLAWEKKQPHGFAISRNLCETEQEKPSKHNLTLGLRYNLG